METQILKINDVEYVALVAKTEEEKEKGLQGVEKLEKDESGRETGMLFVYDEPQHLDFWMKDCSLDLSIVFIGEDGYVISNKHGIPESEEYISEDSAQYVFECNVTSEIQRGDPTSLAEEDDDFDNPELGINKLYIYDSNGDVQGVIDSGARIFSRISTRKIIAKAKKAYTTQEDKDYKALGRYVFKEMKAQDSRPEEYVENEKTQA